MPPHADSLSMPVSRSTRWCLLVTVCLALLTAGPVSAGGRKARNLYEQGRRAELAGDFDTALDHYAAAQAEAPANNRYGLAERRMRFVAGQAHVDAGLRYRKEGLLEQAALEFEQAIAIDPASAVAVQELRRTLELIQKRDSTGDDASGGTLESALEADRAARAERLSRIRDVPTLEAVSDDPISLMLQAESKVVFETIGKLAGINVLFDRDFPETDIEIELTNATLMEALDYVSLLSGAFWKTISHNTVMVAADNPNKRRELEDEIVKTLYLTNLLSVQDLSEVSTAIRGLTDLRRMFTVNSMAAIILRGSPAKVAIAEKIIHDMDKPRPEVIVDVLVLETSVSTMRTLGISPRMGGTKGVSTTLPFRPGGGLAEGAAVTVGQIGGVGSWSAALPDFLVTALFQKSDTNVLQSPRVRASHGAQADVRIGDRIPIATGSFQPGVGGVGINPLVNTQFSYTDVGVNVSLTPQVHANREVSMIVKIEVSNVREFVDLGGISQPVIGQRTIEHDVRVLEGEASVIGGLNQQQMYTTRKGVPFLGELPVIGKLFSEEEVRRTDSEILLVLVPHIVRMPGIDETNLRTIHSGTEQKYTLRYVETGNGRPALAPIGAGQDAVQPAEPAPVATAPSPVPFPEDSVAAEPVPEVGQAPEAQQPAQATEPESAPSPRLFADPSALVVVVGQQIQVRLMVGDAVQVVRLPVRIQYDREKLRLTDVQKGPFLEGADASDIIFSRSIRHANGLAAVNLSRFPGAGGADGEGHLATLVFEGVAAGDATVRVTATGPVDVDNTQLKVEPIEVQVEVQ